MSVVPLSRRRKAELKELASSLGLSEDGVREDLVERIKAHIATSNDHSLRALIREDSPDGTATTVTIYTINNNNSSSGRSSPRKKTTTGVTKETHTSSTSGGVTKGTTTVRRGSNSLSHTEDELEEHEVRKFMDHMHSELSEARDLAKQLEETLHAKFVTNDSSSSHGKGTITETKTSGESRRLSGSSNSRTYLIGGRRGSKDQKSAELSISRHDSGHYSSHFGSEPSPSSHRDNHHESSGKHLLRSRRLHRHDDEDENEDEEGHRRYSKHSGGSFSNQHSGHLHDQRWCSKAFCRLTSGYLDSLCHYVSKPWILLQDIGSTSRGFVWLTMLLELTVFLSQAHAYFKSAGLITSCLSFLINWPNFLQPFFSYYGTFFLLPTLLSQLFNVDRSRSSKSTLTGLLSRHTTSGLSYFVFKFALTYFLGHAIGMKSLLGTTLPSGAKIWTGCKYISDIFRYVPHALGLATSGAGTLLALAESVVQSNIHQQ